MSLQDAKLSRVQGLLLFLNLQRLHKTPEVLDHLRKVCGGGGGQERRRKKNEIIQMNCETALLHDSLRRHAFVHLARGNAEFRRGCWGTLLGGGNSTYQSIWLGAPGLTDLSFGRWNQSTSTDVSTHWDQQALPDPTPPPLFSPSNWPSCRSAELSPAVVAAQLTFNAVYHRPMFKVTTGCRKLGVVIRHTVWNYIGFGVSNKKNNAPGLLISFWNDKEH